MPLCRGELACLTMNKPHSIVLYWFLTLVLALRVTAAPVSSYCDGGETPAGSNASFPENDNSATVDLDSVFGSHDHYDVMANPEFELSGKLLVLKSGITLDNETATVYQLPVDACANGGCGGSSIAACLSVYVTNM